MVGLTARFAERGGHPDDILGARLCDDCDQGCVSVEAVTSTLVSLKHTHLLPGLLWTEAPGQKQSADLLLS